MLDAFLELFYHEAAELVFYDLIQLAFLNSFKLKTVPHIVRVFESSLSMLNVD